MRKLFLALALALASVVAFNPTPALANKAGGCKAHAAHNLMAGKLHKHHRFMHHKK